MTVNKCLLTAILALTCVFNAVALPVYSSRLWDERHEFCYKTQLTAKHAVENGVTTKFVTTILSNSTFKALSKADQLTVFDALYMADRRQSWWWVHDWCMDRLET